MTELCELAIKHGTDKWPWHHYTPHYHEMFKDRRNAVKKVLEIGIGDVEGMSQIIPNYVPGASLRMWAEYFPYAQIYALDNVASILINEGRIHSFWCDQGDEESLRNVILRIGTGFDLIVDDGCHIPEVQAMTARMLVPLLAPGGVYVIEDVWIYPSKVGWFEGDFGLKLSDLPCEAKVIRCGKGDDTLVVL